jgi:glucose-1-phosphate thymidylyltransferase
MIDHGAKIKVIDVEGWYDAGEQGTLLQTNRAILEKGRAKRPASVPAGVTIVDPVYIEDNVTLAASTIGPNVSIGAGSTIENSELRDTVIGAGAKVAKSRLSGSMIGDAAQVTGIKGQINVSDHSVVNHEG